MTLRQRFRLWRLRRAAKYWYDESIAHRRSAQMHQRAIWQCLARGNAHRQEAARIEMQAIDQRPEKVRA